MAPWCSFYHYCTASFYETWTQALCIFKSCSRRVGESQWWGSLTMVLAGNKAKRLSSVNHTTITIYHHHRYFWWLISTALKGPRHQRVRGVAVVRLRPRGSTLYRLNLNTSIHDHQKKTCTTVSVIRIFVYNNDGNRNNQHTVTLTTNWATIISGGPGRE